MCFCRKYTVNLLGRQTNTVIYCNCLVMLLTYIVCCRGQIIESLAMKHRFNVESILPVLYGVLYRSSNNSQLFTFSPNRWDSALWGDTISDLHWVQGNFLIHHASVQTRIAGTPSGWSKNTFARPAPAWRVCQLACILDLELCSRFLRTTSSHGVSGDLVARASCDDYSPLSKRK